MFGNLIKSMISGSYLEKLCFKMEELLCKSGGMDSNPDTVTNELL